MRLTLHPGDLLTRRESEIARLIATGATNRKIATKLDISDQTVKFPLQHPREAVL